MESLLFECVFENPSAPILESVKELWRKYRAIEDEAVIEQRAGQVVYVLRNANGEVAGVSTARPTRASFLNNHFFYEFRCFIAPPFRAPGLDSLLTLKTKQFLEAHSQPSSKFKGILIVVENEFLKKQRTKAVWTATGMVFVGYNSKGDHVRVCYFKDARI